MKIVSACLVGINCNYHGKSNPCEKVIELVKQGKTIPICPEQLGGLPTPRSGSRICSGDGNDVLDGKTQLLTDDGQDVTIQYIKGAYEALKIAKYLDIKEAILKQKSPSCGCGYVQGGLNERKTVEGEGVTTALFKRNGINVSSEEEL